MWMHHLFFFGSILYKNKIIKKKKRKKKKENVDSYKITIMKCWSFSSKQLQKVH